MNEIFSIDITLMPYLIVAIILFIACDIDLNGGRICIYITMYIAGAIDYVRYWCLHAYRSISKWFSK